MAGQALGLTPIVYLLAALFFVLCAMTYVEGASLHQERAGATVFARYAFNELWSFVAGWAILLDFVILVAITAFTATNYLAAFWGELGHGTVEIAAALAIIGFVAAINVMGVHGAVDPALPPDRDRRHRVQVLVIVLGAALVLQLDTVFDGVPSARRPPGRRSCSRWPSPRRRPPPASSRPRDWPARWPWAGAA